MNITTDVVSHNGLWATRTIMDVSYQDLGFEALLASADPANWPRLLPSFWTDMIQLPDDARGWSRMIEHTQNPQGWPKLATRTPLKFWKESDGQDWYRIRYELARDPDIDCRLYDQTVTVDSGLISVSRKDGVGKFRIGVDIHVEKIAAVGFMSPQWSAWMIPFMGLEEQSRRFYVKAWEIAVQNPAPFAVSQSPLAAQ